MYPKRPFILLGFCYLYNNQLKVFVLKGVQGTERSVLELSDTKWCKMFFHPGAPNSVKNRVSGLGFGVDTTNPA